MLRPREKNLNQKMLEAYLEKRAAASKARAKADMAQAEVDLERARIEAAGKRISYDYANGKETMSVVDVVLD